MMRVGVDNDVAAQLFCVPQVAVAEVEAVGVGVMLDGYAEFRGAAKDSGQVDLEGLASKQESSGGVAEDADVRGLDGAEDAGGHFLQWLAEEGMDAGDDDIHLG